MLKKYLTKSSSKCLVILIIKVFVWFSLMIKFFIKKAIKADLLHCLSYHQILQNRVN